MPPRMKAIERYIIYPGQATAYMAGPPEDQRTARQGAKGTGQEIRCAWSFHDTVLKSARAARCS